MASSSLFGAGSGVRLGLVLAISLSYGAGCGDDVPPTPPVTPTLEIGTGESVFMPVDDGGTVDMHVGCQGLQHVWVALRTRGLSASRNIVEISGVRLRDELVTSMPFTARLSFVASGDSASLAGLPMVIEDPANVLGEDIEIRATVRDMSGVYAMATKRVRVQWGAPICGTFDGDGSVRVPDAGPPPPDPDAGSSMDAGAPAVDAGDAVDSGTPAADAG